MHKPKENILFDKLSRLEDQLKQAIQENEILKKENLRLRETEVRSRYFAAHARDLMWSTDLDLKITYVNHYSKNLLGHEPEELMQLGLDKMFPFDTLMHILPYYQQKLKEVRMGNKLKNPINLEVELLHKNGSHVWAELKADFVYDEKGKPVGIIGISRNIEARKKAEQKLKEKEELYRLLLKNTSNTVYLTDEKGHFQFVGQGKDVIFEMEQADVLKLQSINSLFNEDLINVFEKQDSLELRNIRRTIITASGTRKKLLVNIKKVNIKEGKLLFSCHDVTDLEETRRALNQKELEFEMLKKKRNSQQKMIEKAEDIAKWGSWQWNMKEKTFTLSPGWRKIHGYFSDKADFDDIEKIIHPDDLPRLKQEINKAIENQGYGEVEVRVIIPGTSNVKHVRTTGKVIYDENNRPIKMMGYVRDLSEQRQTEIYLRDNIIKYRKIIDDAPVGIALLSRGSFAFANNALAEIYGSNDAFSLLKKDLTDFVHEEDVEQLKEKLAHFSAGDGSFDISHRIYTPDKKVKMLKMIATGITIDREEYIHAVVEEIPAINGKYARDSESDADAFYLSEKAAFVNEIVEVNKLLSGKYQFEEKDRRKVQNIINKFDDREKRLKILQDQLELQHKEFFARLSKRFPFLTQHELRHCGCIVMNLSTREIATLFDIKPSSIQKSRVRLKKKLNLDPQEDLRNYLHSF